MPSRLTVAPGQTYGRLTVLDRAEDHYLPSGRKKPRWLCRCECGGELVTMGARLRAGDVRSCGCLLVETVRRMRERDITSERVGALVAVERLPAYVSPNGHHASMWRWRCDCGVTVDAQPVNVRKRVGLECSHG